MAKRIKLPKQVAGIRLARPRRRSPVAAFLRSSGGRVIIAELLLVLAGVLVAAANPATRTGRGLREAVTGGARAPHAGSSAVATNGRARGRAAIVGSVVAWAIAAFRAAIAGAGARPARVADLTAEVEDVTPAEPGKEEPRTSRSRIRRRARRVTDDSPAGA